MMKTFSVIAAVLMSQVALADGNFSLDLQPGSSRVLIDVSHTGNVVKGSISPSRLSPFVNLTGSSVDGWQGQVGQQISSVQVQDQGNGRTNVTIAALPGGWYSYTVTQKSNGDVEVNGTGPQGNLNSAGVKKSGSEVYFGSTNFSYDLTGGQDGKFQGTVVSGWSNSGYGYLTVDGDLTPAIASTDPVLFILLYVLPFTQ